MKTLILIMFLLLIQGCGAGKIDPAFIGIVNDFVSDAKNYGHLSIQVNSSIEFGDVAANCSTEGSVGCCSHNDIDSMEYGKITIDQNAWQNMQNLDEMNASLNNTMGVPGQQKMLLYHEMAHCVLGRSHNSMMSNFSIYDMLGNSTGVVFMMDSSIMNPYIPPQYYLQLGGAVYYHSLLKELFLPVGGNSLSIKP